MLDGWGGHKGILWEGHGEMEAGSCWQKGDETATIRGRTRFPPPRIECDILEIVGDLHCNPFYLFVNME